MVSWRLISHSELDFSVTVSKTDFGFTDTKTVLNAEDDDTDDVQGFLFRTLK